MDAKVAKEPKLGTGHLLMEHQVGLVFIGDQEIEGKIWLSASTDSAGTNRIEPNRQTPVGVPLSDLR